MWGCMIQGDNIKLVRFEERFITPEYMEWINDQDLNRYIDLGRLPVLRNDVWVPDGRDFIQFGIMAGESFLSYIGFCSLHNISWIDRRAEIGYMIGNSEYCGRGLASETVDVLCGYAFSRLGFNKVDAHIVEENMASIRVVEKNEFSLVATIPKHYYLEGRWLSELVYMKERV